MRATASLNPLPSRPMRRWSRCTCRVSTILWRTSSMPSSSPSMSWNEPQCHQRHWLSLYLMVRFLNPFFSFSARKKRTVSNCQEKTEGTVPTVVLKFSQNISIFSRPSRRSLPSERASRSARAFRRHRRASPTSIRSRFQGQGPWSLEGVWGNHSKGFPTPSFPLAARHRFLF